MLPFERLDPAADPIQASDPAYDPLLGYRPVPGERKHPDGWVATIDESRLRLPGLESRPGGAPWLAIGDSFTFGDEVMDDETWPAQLERIANRRVVNAGVFGYGLDQAVLRAERLMERESFERVILSVISGDVDRCEASYLFERWKPYFDLEDGELVLRNTPVPTEAREPPLLRRALGWSYAFRGLARRIAPDWWFYGRGLYIHDRGDEVAQRLMDRLARVTRDHGAELFVVALVDRELEAPRLPPLLAHLDRAGIAYVDLVGEIRRRSAAEGRDALFMPLRHLNAQANRWVAEEVSRGMGGSQGAGTAGGSEANGRSDAG